MEYITVKELFKITKGKKVEEIDYKNENSIRYIQIDDLRNNNNIKHCENINKYVIAKKEDIIIAWDGANAGTIGFGIEGAIGSTLAILRKENKEMDTEFCGLFLRSKSAYLREKCTGATIPHIQRRALEDIKIPKISLNKQIEIKNIINKAQELIDKRKEQIQDLDELVKSQFIEIFGDPVSNPKGWKKVICKDITSKIGSGATPSGGNSSYKEEGISLIRSMNVHNNKFVYKDLAFIDDEQAKKLKNVTIEENDILLNITGASVARSCIVPSAIIPARVNQHVSIIRCKHEDILPVFLVYQFTSESYQRKLWDIATSGGATREAITKQQLENLELIVPPIEIQNKFIEFIKVNDKLKFEMEKSLKELEDNFNALMQKAFNGELFN